VENYAVLVRMSSVTIGEHKSLDIELASKSMIKDRNDNGAKQTARKLVDDRPQNKKIL